MSTETDWDEQDAGNFINSVADRFLDPSQLTAQVSPGSQIEGDDAKAGGHYERVSRVSYQALVAAGAGVLAIRGILTNSTGYASASFGPAIRSALLPAMRALSVLCPDDRMIRTSNALRSAAMEAEDEVASLRNLRTLDAIFDFSSNLDLAAEADEQIENAEIERNRLRSLLGGAPPKETRVLAETAKMVGELLDGRGVGGSFPPDALRRMWIVYSADAHGWSWQYRFRDKVIAVDDLGSGYGTVRREVNTAVVLADSVLCMTMANMGLDYWRMRSLHSDSEVAASRES